MKKTILLISLLIFVCSCEKKEDTLVLTGTWTLYQTFTSGSTFTWTITITQNGNNLTGNAVISDDSGYALLLSSSNNTGTNVTIEWMLSTYKLSCRGTVNSNFNSMNGDFFSDDTKVGVWLANKKL